MTKHRPRIKTCIINLEKRKDRLDHILEQFSPFGIFDLQIRKAIECERGTLGLWLTVKSIVKDCLENGDPYVLIVEDDHSFTEHFSEQGLLDAIEMSQKRGAEVLSGGISWFDFTVRTDDGLNWINSFTGLQFTLLFQNLYAKLLETELTEDEVADKKISSICKRKYCVYPFFSTQAEFGYSDATEGNGQPGKVSNFFAETNQKFHLINKVYAFYKR